MISNTHLVGVWVDEFNAMGLGDCLDYVWNKAEVFLHSGEGGKKCVHGLHC
jgi:hypothetical protein